MRMVEKSSMRVLRRFGLLGVAGFESSLYGPWFAAAPLVCVKIIWGRSRAAEARAAWSERLCRLSERCASAEVVVVLETARGFRVTWADDATIARFTFLHYFRSPSVPEFCRSEARWWKRIVVESRKSEQCTKAEVCLSL
jgi:hypothetical protein